MEHLVGARPARRAPQRRRGPVVEPVGQIDCPDADDLTDRPWRASADPTQSAPNTGERDGGSWAFSSLGPPNLPALSAPSALWRRAEGPRRFRGWVEAGRAPDVRSVGRAFAGRDRPHIAPHGRLGQRRHRRRWAEDYLGSRE